MKVCVAVDSFKGSFSSREAIACARQVLADDEVIGVEIADGGEGFLGALARNLAFAQMREQTIMGSDGTLISAKYLWDPSTKTGYIEVAEVIGLPQVAPSALHPELHTTYGIGQLILCLLDLGAVSIVIGLGGSCTTDGGLGMMQALGCVFYATDKTELAILPMPLLRVASLDISGLDQRLSAVHFIGACDVRNPLIGQHGTAAVFGPQKGLTADEVVQYDQGLQTYAHFVEAVTGRSVRMKPGSGAAGGLGFAMFALLGADYQSGIDLILDQVHFTDILAHCDLVVSGEGHLDSQSFQGKGALEIIKKAQAQGCASLFFYGGASRDLDLFDSTTSQCVFLPIADGPMSLEVSIHEGATLFSQALRRSRQLWSLAQSHSDKSSADRTGGRVI